MGKRILYAASTCSHLLKFHEPYIAELRRLGHSVTTLAGDRGADAFISLDKRLLSLNNLFAIASLRRYLRREKFDLIILNTTLMSVAVRLALPRKNRPRVLNISHGYLFTLKKRGIRARVALAFERLLAHRTDSVAVMNSEDRELALRYRLFREHMYFTRGMGVTPLVATSDRCKMRHILGLHGDFTLVFVGELSKRKNQELLIRAIPKLIPHIPSIRLLLVGCGVERVRLLHLAERLKVSERVHLLGERRDVGSLVLVSDLYVSASLSEGLPFNVVEALSLGATVLVSDVKGHRDIIRSGIDGYLFKNNKVSDFVNKTCQIYSKKLYIDPRAAKDRSSFFTFNSASQIVLNILRKEIDNA